MRQFRFGFNNVRGREAVAAATLFGLARLSSDCKQVYFGTTHFKDFNFENLKEKKKRQRLQPKGVAHREVYILVSNQTTLFCRSCTGMH